jgi:ZIP family zinc transporter
MVLIVSLLTLVATFLGGLFALRFKDKLHLVLGFSAGAVIGVAFFDLLPEALDLGATYYDVATITTVIVVGFLIFMVLDRVFSIHAHDDDHCENLNHRGKISATTLAVHSLLDGVAIGLAFHVSNAIGLVVAAAVLTHDFSDGINTINIVLKNKGTNNQAMKWLAVDALAPALGALVTLFFTVPDGVLGIILALFCGFFLYIGASDLLPESHHRHPSYWTTVATLLGVAVLYGAVRLAGV